jgi:serine/threonine-protein kinase
MKTVSLQPGRKAQRVPLAFLCSLRDSGLLSDDQLAHVQRLLPGTDFPTLEALLLETGWLTPYQLKRIADDEPRGLILGQYRIVDQLGEGGFGKVYKAVHAIMDRLAAVKVSNTKWVQESEARELFLREVVAATRLTHPNIALAYEANETDGCLWFAMEYVAGPTLEQFVLTRPPLPVPFVCAVMHQVAQALQYAHEQGMVHRDIKPGNLLLPGGESGSPRSGVFPVLVKVVDFGLARCRPKGARPAFTISQDGLFIGTPEYTSPEQARDSSRVDIRSDLYSLGCTFYFALTGQPPFVAPTPLETVNRHQDTEAAAVQGLRPDVPGEVAAIVHRLLAKKPEDRFQTPADLADALGWAVRNPTRTPVPARGSSPEHPAPAASAQSAPVAAPPPPEPKVSSGTQDERAPDRSTAAPDAAPVASRPRDDVPALWREWLGIITAFVQGIPSNWKEEDYRVLHASLLRGLRDREAPDGPSSLAARLETVVEPWLRLRTLADLDRKSLVGLWETCHRLGAEFPAPTKTFNPWWLVGALLAGVSFLVTW